MKHQASRRAGASSRAGSTDIRLGSLCDDPAASHSLGAETARGCCGGQPVAEGAKGSRDRMG